MHAVVAELPVRIGRCRMVERTPSQLGPMSMTLLAHVAQDVSRSLIENLKLMGSV